jgi:uncharacterized protein YycO
MKRSVIYIGASLIIAAVLLSFSEGKLSSSFNKKNLAKAEYQTGDIIFQSSKTGQGHAIQLATGSKYSHVGLILMVKGQPMVFEAVQPVQLIDLKDFTKRGDGHFVVTRLKGADTVLTDKVKEKMQAQLATHLNKSYDIHFDWSDEKMYCSELVWKVYKVAAGLEVGELKPLKEYDLSHPVVKETMEARYGDNIPWDEPMISPGEIFESPLFEVVKKG